jgi:hypothetical protein
MSKNYKNYLVQDLELDCAKRYKNSKKELEFDYIPKKEFEKLEKKQNTTFGVVGSIKLKETNKTKTDNVTIHFNDRMFIYELENVPEDTYDKSERPSNVMGYLKVGDDEYVAIVKTNILFLILFPILGIIILTIGLLLSTGDGNKPDPDSSQNSSVSSESKPSLDIESGQDITDDRVDEDDKIQESITIPGYANLYVSTKNPSISLINPEGNSVYLRYIIKNGEEVIYETKALEPNKMVKANLKELLPNGEYELTFIIETYDIKTQSPCNGATQEVKFLVKD